MNVKREYIGLMNRNRDNGFFKKFTIGLILLAVTVIAFVSPASAVDINSCQEINQSGYYKLTSNITNSAYGVCINITASDVIFDGNGFTIDGVGNSNTYGIYVHNSTTTITNVTITNVSLSDWDRNIGLNNVQNSNISSVTSSGSTGIYISSSSNNNVSKNTITQSSGSGIDLVSSSGNSIYDNIIQSGTGRGISLHNSFTNTIINNTITSNFYGLEIVNSNSNVVANNTITNSGYLGLNIIQSTFNKIYNNIFNNSNNVSVTPTYVNTWNITNTTGTNIIGGNFLGGNYWANPTGSGFSQLCGDKNGDGFCDDPFTINANNIDYLPLTYPDTSEPLVTINYPQNNTIYNKNITYINVTVTDDRIIDSVIAQIDGTTNVTLVKVGNYYINDTINLGNGTHSIRIYANDTSGNMNSSQFSNFTVLIGAILDCGEVINTSGYYYLIYDLANSAQSVCIEITVDDVILDGKGHTVDGLDFSFSTGIRVLNFTSKLTNITIKNTSLSDWYHGLLLSAVSGGYVENITANSNYKGIVLSGSDNITVTSTSATMNYAGIEISASQNNTVNQSTISGNSYGVWLTGSSSSNNISDNVIAENSVYDIKLLASPATLVDLCSNIVTNNTGSGGRPIGYFNSQITLTNQTYSELILCNADGSVLTNITVKGSDSLDNNGFVMIGTENSHISVFNSSHNYEGAFLYYSNNVTLTSLIFVNNKDMGMTLSNSFNNTILNSIFNDNGNDGLYMYYSNNNTFVNCSFNSNFDDGVELQDSDNNTFTNSTFNKNGGSGIEFNSDNNGNKILYSDILNNYGYGIEFDWDYASYNVISHNNISKNSWEGIYFDEDYYDYNEISYNIISYNGNDGIEFDDDSNDYNKIVNNIIIHNSGDGIYLDDDTDYTTIANNTISFNSFDGIDVDSIANNVIISNNTVVSNGDRGIEVTSSSAIITNNFLDRNVDGIYLGGWNGLIKDNTILNHTQKGIYLFSADDAQLSNNKYYNNTVDFYSIQTSNSAVTMEDIGGIILSFFHAGNILISPASSPAPPPSGYKNVGNYFINITNTSPNAWVNLKIHYKNADASGVVENTIRVWEFKGGSWHKVSGTNGVNTANNYGYANITSFSIFTLLGEKPKPSVGGGYAGGGGGFWINTTPTPTPTPTPSPTPTSTPKITPTPTATPYATPQPTLTPTATPEVTETPEKTPTPEITKTPEEISIDYSAYYLIAGVIVVGGLLLFGLLGRRRKKEEE